MSGRQQILETHTPALFTVAVTRAVEQLRAGEIVALPTETVYGLAANAFDPAAVARVFAVKDRPAYNPIIVHVADLALARRCAARWSDLADRLAAAFWPGPLTLVVPKALAVPDIVTAGGGTVGIRWPSHPFMQAVIRECGFPLAAPSANRANGLSPTNADHVRASLGDRVSLIVDGGQCQVGIESTVLDVTGARVRILRPGMIHRGSLAAVVGQPIEVAGEATAAAVGLLRSPGQLPRHYAPRATLRTASWTDNGSLREAVRRFGGEASRTWIVAHSHIPGGEGWAGVSVVPRDAEAFARALYGELHRCDANGAALIVVETPPDSPEWQGIADRVRRAGAA